MASLVDMVGSVRLPKNQTHRLMKNCTRIIHKEGNTKPPLTHLQTTAAAAAISLPSLPAQESVDFSIIRVNRARLDKEDPARSQCGRAYYLSVR